LAVNRTSNRQINFRVTDEEYQKIEQLANDTGMTVPMFCKTRAQNIEIAAPKINKESAAEIAQELRRIGVNINQIAKHLNSGEGRSTSLLDVFRGIEKEVGAIWQQLSSAIRK